MTRTVRHDHVPLWRVGARSWTDPLDAAFSRDRPDNRWNTSAFPALYCCCSLRVARAVVEDRWRRLSVDLADLTPDARPELAEIDWAGLVVDVASREGLEAHGFPPDYPAGVDRADCRRAAAAWHDAGCEGVVCRSAALYRLGRETRWEGDHAAWGEVAVFTARAERKPVLRRRREDLGWLTRS
ncbi:MAG TPA: RES domain-containing protein [Vicinamibacterales bacterium]|nr:RES domain-containing protein [Vicinamibacterales bacterium]